MGRLSSEVAIALASTIGTFAALLVSCVAMWIAYQTMRQQGVSRNDVEVRMIEIIAMQIGVTTPRYVCHTIIFYYF